MADKPENNGVSETRLSADSYNQITPDSPVPTPPEKKFVSLKHRSEDEQPREKLMKHGAGSLTDGELIAILMGTGTKQRSAVDISNDVLDLAHGDLFALHTMNWEGMQKVSGVGPAKAITIYAAIELGYRMRNRTSTLDTIKNSNDIVEIMRNDIEMLHHEELWLIFLNNNNKVIKKHNLSKGGLTATLFDIRIAMKEALLAEAVAVIMTHNHPSGNKKPSEQDKRITHDMKVACEYMGMRLLDHVIIVGNDHYSFMEEGLLATL